MPAVVLIGGPGEITNIVFHHLEQTVGPEELVVVVEQRPSRVRLAWRRARRHRWSEVAGQVAFVSLLTPILRWLSRRRIAQVLREHGLDTRPPEGVLRVGSVNDDRTIELLSRLRPKVVVVQGTRIISPAVLAAVPAPFVNLHAGITPRYRGVHGGYWALTEERPGLVGSTVHLIDAGIDTGGILGQATFDVTGADTIASYPYLHVAAALPLLDEQVKRAVADGALVSVAALSGAEESQLRLHPTAWGYIRTRVGRGVR